MKLSHECIRDVLITSEEETGLNNILQNEKLYEAPRLKKYEKEDIIYTIKKLMEAGYVHADVMIHIDGSMAMLGNLTHEGHLFIDNIKDEGIWNKTKKQIKKTSSSTSINVISRVAESVALNLNNLN